MFSKSFSPLAFFLVIATLSWGCSAPAASQQDDQTASSLESAPDDGYASAEEERTEADVPDPDDDAGNERDSAQSQEHQDEGGTILGTLAADEGDLAARLEAADGPRDAAAKEQDDPPHGDGGDSEATDEDPEVEGALDREVIRRVVRRHREQARACYERSLLEDPDLAGKITVNWVISHEGKVISSTIAETTMDDRDVERCLADAIKRWRFPEPDGGGVVRVNYPFTFESK